MLKKEKLRGAELLFFLSLIFIQVQIYGFSIPFWIGLILVAKSVITSKGRLRSFDKYEKCYMLFVGYVVIHEVIGALFTGDRMVLNCLVETIAATGIVIHIYRHFSYEKTRKVYTLVCLFASVFILFHSYEVYLLGHAISPIQLIPGVFSQSSSVFYRPCGFFSEPQAYATFVIPLVYMLISEKRLKMAIYFTITVFLTTSTLGIVIVFAIWITYIFSTEFSVMQKAGLILIISLAVFFLMYSQTMFFARDKLLQTDYSSNVRITQGFEIYSKIPNLSEKLFGIFRVDPAEYISRNGITLSRMALTEKSYKWSYFTSVAGILIYYGIPGLLSFVYFILKEWKLVGTNSRIFILIIVMLSFGQTLLFNVWYVLVYALFFVNIRHNEHLDTKGGIM